MEKTLSPANINDFPMYPANVQLSITIAPEYQHCIKVSDIPNRPRLETVYCIRHFIRWVRPYAHIMLIPEIGKRTGRWHYHGVINIHDSFGFHCFALPRITKCSFLKIDVINDQDKWTDYLFKCQPVMQPALEKLGLPYILEGDTKEPTP